LSSRLTAGDPRALSRSTEAIVDLGAIARNYRLLHGRVGEKVAVIPVLKADAYGHGAAAVARRLAAERANRFAVGDAREGIGLRRAGVPGEILLLNFCEAKDLPLCRGYGLTPTLYDMEQARGFKQASAGAAAPLPVQLKLDTGLGRLGFRPEQLPDLAELLRAAPGLRIEGVFSHLASAEKRLAAETSAQIRVFRDALSALAAAGISTGLVHLANSAGVLAHPDSHFDAVRPGIALYGVPPWDSREQEGLEPAMRLETGVMSVRRVPGGTPLGYGGTFVTSRPSTVAVLPIGYHDGLRRSFSGRVSFLLRGREVPIVGAVSMDLTMLDATDCGASPGDRVVCLGSDSGLAVTAWDLARAAGTIPYEIVCGIGSRVARRYVP
jgi:alanine racemase